ncbi:putative GTP-binding protein [Cellvibrio sp. BR]|uniref:ribosome rescue GTPase HflX n=1 Tax=unclassified Cellvibrio TaxID=2624793 RepID=UPI00026017CA|nr:MULTISPECIES: ribosome rescue GTPase HflX [unclassified Cellvibrio]EIK43382.1 putative GTP-binding protein [Cellvibrio sp. BR]UUA72252.1 GTPase HflX [Cellvibrio sp. QJXJ]
MFFDRPESGELAVLVHLNLSHGQDAEDPREFEELVLSAGGDPVAFLTGSRIVPTAKFLISTGKLQELQQLVVDNGAELVIFNHTLTPSQERNLERELQCRVLDRTGLILDIFAQRARTFEGKLQVELAQLRHSATRLIRGWTHLERQKGGIGLRGPGETQLETDRRLLRNRIGQIEQRLEKVRSQREQGRRSRQRAAIPTVSLVGYTNAGKSTLFNRITGADVYAENKLFATLDPTMRRIELSDVGAVVLADTVGFISHLPHRLVEAFKATLEEASNSTLLLHVIDSAAEERLRNIEQVELVLEEIEAADLPQLRVYNKVDLLADTGPHIDRDETGKPIAVWLSAQTGAGCELLNQAISEVLGKELVSGCLVVPPTQGRLRAMLYAQQAVVSENHRADGASLLQVRIPKDDLLRILSAANIAFESLLWDESGTLPDMPVAQE